jgi:hypothetical protein
MRLADCCDDLVRTDAENRLPWQQRAAHREEAGGQRFGAACAVVGLQSAELVDLDHQDCRAWGGRPQVARCAVDKAAHADETGVWLLIRPCYQGGGAGSDPGV